MTSLTIPNSVTAIGGAAFYDCSSLSSVVFPNNISVIRTLSFSGCNNLSTFTVPNSVTRIDRSAFAGCSSLTKIYIGNGVKCICDCAFTDCPELKDVYCLVESILPTDYFSDYEGDLSRGGELDISDGIDYTYVSGGGLYTWTSAFNGLYTKNATLHVPAAAIEAYMNTAPWSGFKSFVAIGKGELPETYKCSTPEISYANGKLTFTCETEGAECVATITNSDIKTYYGNEITMSLIFNVAVYATKAGYENSDVATREIVIENGQTTLFGDLNKDGKVNVADHVELSKIILNQEQHDSSDN